MADETIDIPAFDLGVLGSEQFGDLKSADAFLNGDEPKKTKTKGAPKTEEDEDEEEATPPVKKKATPKPLEFVALDEKGADDFLNADEEEDEEDEKEEKPEPPKKKKIAEQIEAQTDGDEDEDEEDNQYAVIAKGFYKTGVLTTEEGEEPVIPKTPEEFIQRFNDEKRKGAGIYLENYLERFGDDRKDLFQAIYVDGVEPREYIAKYTEVEDFANVDLQSESNQEKVVRTYYKGLGWKDEKIDTKIDRLKSYSELAEEAENVHPLLLEEKTKQLEEIRDKKAEEQRQLKASDDQYREGVKKFLTEKLKTKSVDGIPLTQEKASKVFDFLYVKKWKTASGEILTDFDKFVLDSKNETNIGDRIKIALLKLGNFDFSSIEKAAISKKSTDIFNFTAKKDKPKKTVTTNEGW